MSDHASWLPLPLVGRDAELLTLRGGLDAAAGGACTLQVLAGGYGVGKTRLLQAVLDETASRGYDAAMGVAYQNDVNVPYAAFVDALTPLVRTLEPATLSVLARGTEAELAQVIPAIGVERNRQRTTDDAGDLTTRVRWHFAQFLGRLTARRPLLLAIDNVQWADPSSVSLLQFIVRHAPEARLMAVMAYNPMEADAASPFRAMARSLPGRDTAQITLAPLTERDVRAILAQAFGVDAAAVRDFAALLHARTLGNPFFIEEILKTLVDRGSIRFVDARWVGWNLEDFELPTTVRDVVLARVRQLTPPARQVADVAAVFGVRVGHELLESASGLSPREFGDAVEELRARHVAVDIEEGAEIAYDFTHPVLQRTLYEEVGAARRRDLHGRIAEVIERRSGSDADRHATQLAHHFVRSATSLAPKSYRYLVLAGRDALAKHANREAARYLQHALDIIDRGAPVGGTPARAVMEGGGEGLTALLEDLARVRQRLTEYDASRVLWLRARDMRAALGDEASLARIERRLGLLTYVWGHVEQSLAHFDAALEHARLAGRRDIEVRALVAKGTALQTQGSVEDAKQLMHQALAIVEPLGDDGARARVERMLQALYTISGPVGLAREFGRRALAHAEAAGEQGVAWSSHWTSAALGGLTANGDEVAHHCAQAARIARELNSPMLAANIAEVQLECWTASGQWAEGLALAERMIPVARAVSPRTLLPRMLVWTGTILLWRGETERAGTCFDESWVLSRAGAPDATAGDINTVIVAHLGQAAYHLATRNWIGAVEYAQRGLAIGDRYKYVVWAVYRLLPILGEGALWLGDFALAEWVGKRLREEAPKLSERIGRAYVAALDGLLLRLEHNRPESIPRLLAAADEFEAVSYPYYGARLRRTTAQMMWKLGDRDGAARELRRAHDVFLRLGAASELHATREEMRQVGVRPPARSVVPGGVLTEREREIALLVARHKTNKEIARALDISSRTVSTHLSNVFQKLGVDSRAALTDAIRTDAALKS